MDKDKIKNGIIVGLILIIVFGTSFFASELQNRKACEDAKNSAEGAVTEQGNIIIEAENEANSISEAEMKDHKNISVAEYISLKESSKASIIYIARPTCSYCLVADPILKNIAYKYNLTINYINTDEISDDEALALVKSDGYFSEGYGTPLLLIVKNNQIINVSEGLNIGSHYINFFKENGVINE
jgi:thiol-disulfide isomerase/thioredoxin